jgi:ectoine hydroxylase-related dioxygenase (phytanoyl-CoA dioxygenase family)
LVGALAGGLSTRALEEEEMKDNARSAAPLSRFRDSFRNTAHVVGEFVSRLPNPVVQARYALGSSQEAKEYYRELKQTGVVVLRDFVDASRLLEMQQDFYRLIDTVSSLETRETREEPRRRWMGKREYVVEEVDEKGHVIICRDALRYSRRFFEIVLDKTVLNVVGRYFRRPFLVQHSDGRRLLPMRQKDFGPYKWHHDAKGTKINMIILLSEVTEDDQRMTYLKGSHRFFHNFTHTVRSSFKQREVRAMREKGKQLEPFECTGKPGDVILFDGNGLHRGNRNTGRTRDTFMVRYSAKPIHGWRMTIPKAFLDGCDDEQLAALNRNRWVRYV